MKPCVLVQNNAPVGKQYIVGLYTVVSRFAIDKGYDLIDRSMTESFNPDDCGVDWSQYGPVLVYGSTDFVEACSKSEHLSKYIFNDRSAIACSTISTKLRDKLFNSDGWRDSVARVTQGFNVRGNKNVIDGLFIRPDLAHKAFNGGVYTKQTWRTLVEENKLPKDLDCWVAPPKKVPAKEWRCWVVDGKIAGASQYMENGKVSVVPINLFNNFFWHAVPIILHLNKQYEDNIPACYTVDFALPAEATDLSEIKIVELNCINSSGWYGLSIVPDILDSWMEYLITHYREEEKGELVA